MLEFFTAIGTAFGVVFVAELGDKTQLLALGFGARHRLGVVALGLTLGYAIANVIATIVGALLGAALPERPIAIAAGVLFLGFAVWTLLDDGANDEPERMVRTGGVVVSIALSITIAEMGDKTQLATAALAARNQPIGTWIGATAGAASAGLVGAVFGQRIGRHLSERALSYATAALFAAFGAILLATV